MVIWDFLTRKKNFSPQFITPCLPYSYMGNFISKMIKHSYQVVRQILSSINISFCPFLSLYLLEFFCVLASPTRLPYYGVIMFLKTS